MAASVNPRGEAAPRGVELALARHRRKYEAEVQRLLDATLALMREGDSPDPTVSEILARAHLSTSAFYRHFPTKDDLFVTLLEQAHELTAAHLAQRLADVDSPVERIELWVRALFDLARTEESVARNRPLLLAHPRLLQQFPGEILSGFAALTVPMSAAIAEARAAAGLDTATAASDARLALHQIFGMLIDAAAVRRPVATDDIEAVVSYTLRAVLAESPPRTGRSRLRRS